MRRLSLALPLLPATAWAAADDATGSVLNMLFGLAIVLAVLFALLHVLKRVQQHGGATLPLKVIGAAALGPRERVVLVEVADTVLVLGVAAGGVSTLHTLAASALPQGGAGKPLPAGEFAARLLAAMKGRHSGN